MVYKAMLQLADQDTSPLSEGGLVKQLHLHNHRVWGIGFLMAGPPLEKRHCRVMSNMIDMCVFMDYLFIYSPFVYIP